MRNILFCFVRLLIGPDPASQLPDQLPAEVGMDAHPELHSTASSALASSSNSLPNLSIVWTPTVPGGFRSITIPSCRPSSLLLKPDVDRTTRHQLFRDGLPCLDPV